MVPSSSGAIEDARGARIASAGLRAVALLGFLLSAICLMPIEAAAQQDAADEAVSPGEGYGGSYWGWIPAPSDSVSAMLAPEPRPLWEYPLLVPYRIVQLPIRGITTGAGAGYVYMEEKGIFRWLGELLGPKPVPYGAMVAFKAGGLSGVGGGLTLYHNAFFGSDNRMKLRTTLTSTGEAKGTIGILLARGRRESWELGAGYRLRRNSRYFGLGPQAREDDKSYYSQETAWGGAVLSRRVHGPIRVELGSIFSSVGTRLPHEDREPALHEVFDGSEARPRPFGYGDRSQGVSWSLTLIRDATTTARRPESGGVQRFRSTYFASIGDEAAAAFWSYRFEVEQFFGLWHSERALATRAYVNWLDDSTDEIPFQRLLTNDEPDLFRGFQDFRWRDRGLVGLSLEYRWPLWVDNRPGGAGLDVYVLSDIGQVFHRFEEISSQNLQVSYGGGVRVVGRNDFTGRIEAAWSEEEFVFRLASDQIFQYAGGGLFNGRDQSALR